MSKREEIEAAQRASKEWAMFALGKWTRTPPAMPGTYPTAVLDGSGSRGPDVVVYNNPNTKKLEGTKTGGFNGPLPDVWQGWWWSKPYPQLPPVPKGETAR